MRSTACSAPSFEIQISGQFEIKSPKKEEPMPAIRYDIVPQGLMMSVDGAPTYWFDRKASFGILWEQIADDHFEIVRHGRVEAVIEREASMRTFYAEIGAVSPKTGKAFATVEQIDTATVEIINRVLAGEEKPHAIITAMKALARAALLRAMPAHKRYLVEAA
jgi:hypothetical protein